MARSTCLNCGWEAQPGSTCVYCGADPTAPVAPVPVAVAPQQPQPANRPRHKCGRCGASKWVTRLRNNGWWEYACENCGEWSNLPVDEGVI